MKKNVLLVGSGGREHAIALALSKSPQLGKLYTAPGNPGTAQFGQNLDITDTDLSGLLSAAKDYKIDLTMVGPETPLSAGIVDLFETEGLRIVGPNQIAAQLESSKQWSKGIMKRAGIPTADYESFSDYDLALAYIQSRQFPIVIKADGLAAGKGVMIAADLEQAKEALADCLIHQKFEQAGASVVVEDFLEGEEASLFAFTDGKTILPMIAAQDHKAIFDGDKGPNTGGMGAYAPAPVVNKSVLKKVKERVFEPLIRQFQAEGIDYKGIIYAGLMIKDNNPYIIEFNARFGDPETQIVLPLLKTDLLTVLDAIPEQRLSDITLEWSTQSAVTVVIASKGYPGSYSKGKEINGLESFKNKANIELMHAGTKLENGKVYSNGGRVLNIVGIADTLDAAIHAAYSGVQLVYFEGAYFRTDIGQKGLKHL